MFKIFSSRYYQNADDLIDYLSKIHLEVNLPSIIALEGLENYIDNDKCEQVFYF